MKTIKPKICKICGKEIKINNSLINYCSIKCKKEIDRIKKEEKSKKLSITIQGLSKEQSRIEIRSKLEEFMPNYLETKKVIIKVSKGKIKSDAQKLKKQLDTIFSEYIRLRDGKCVICGSMKNLNNGHYFSRVCNALRFSEINCNTQCASCNFKHEQDEKPYTDWMLENYGYLVVDKLRSIYYGNPVKLSNDWYKEQIEIYKLKIANLKQNLK